MSTQRIHSPQGEPFDVPGHRDVSELLLYKGWTRGKPDPKAIPLVQTIARAPAPELDDAILWPRHPEPTALDQAELEAEQDAQEEAFQAEHVEATPLDNDDLDEAVEDEPTLPRRRRRPAQSSAEA